MGFPFNEATWNVVTDAMFTGWGSIAPGLYTFIAVVSCIVILWLGNRSEKSKYDNHS